MDGTTTTFGKQNGVLISRKVIAVIAGIFLVGIIATGLLAYNLTSCPSKNINYHQINYTTTSIITTTTEAPSTLEVSTTPSEEVTIIPEKKLDVRLPRSVAPKSYHIKIIPFIYEGNFTFHGEVDIVVQIKEDTGNITLHFDDIKVDESSISVIAITDDSMINVEKIENDTSRLFLIIHLEETLEKGKLFKVHIKYWGVLNDILQGFYRSSYTVENQTR